MRPRSDIERTLAAHGASVWRACVLYFKASPDAQDAYQETFLRYATADAVRFADDEHRKAWLIRVATNVCKDMLKAASRRTLSLDAEEGAVSAEQASEDPSVQPGSFASEVADALRTLDDPPRTPLYLSLYEGYTAPEIAQMLAAPVNTVYSWIARGKEQLREALS